MVKERNESEERDAKRRRQPTEDDRLAGRAEEAMKTVFASSAAMQRDMDAVLAEDARLARRADKAMYTVFAYSSAMQRDIDAVLAYSFRIEKGEPEMLVKLKILNVWTLTKCEHNEYRITMMTSLKAACEAAQADVEDKWLNGAIERIDAMINEINNIETEEKFDD